MSQSRLEFLPNEILLQCFQYLNIINIFRSFNQLNYRFNSLIRNIPFNLTFENIHDKSQCEQFCMKMFVDPTIKNQLYSLHLSNENTCYPIHLFTSKFILLEFRHLCSLTLNGITNSNWKYFLSILSLLPELSSFRITHYRGLPDNLIFILPISQLQTLVLTQSFPESISNIQFSSIIHLSISDCNINRLFDLLNNASKLIYLKIDHVYGKYSNTTRKDTCCTNNHVSNIKVLIMKYFTSEVYDLVILLQQTPNLENLIIQTLKNPIFVNARQWENLITSSLPYLKIFQFRFEFNTSTENNINEKIFKKFSKLFLVQ